MPRTRHVAPHENAPCPARRSPFAGQQILRRLVDCRRHRARHDRRVAPRRRAHLKSLSPATHAPRSVMKLPLPLRVLQVTFALSLTLAVTIVLARTMTG